MVDKQFSTKRGGTKYFIQEGGLDKDFMLEMMVTLLMFMVKRM